MRMPVLAVMVLTLLATAGCDIPDRRGDWDEGGGGGGGSGGGSSDRDWCMTCGGSGWVHYVTTDETEVCPTCHGTGER
jgi:hypothetical protein